MTTKCPAITLIQPVPDAAWFERQAGVYILASFGHPELATAKGIAAHLRGNLSVNADAVLVDGPTLARMLSDALNWGTPANHGYECGKKVSMLNPCTCWQRLAKAMLDSLKEAMA